MRQTMHTSSTCTFKNLAREPSENMDHTPIFIIVVKIHFDKFEGADFKYDKSFFRFWPKRANIKHFWAQTRFFFLLHKTLHSDKFHGVDLKYENSFFKFQSKNTQKTFLIPISKVFCFTCSAPCFLLC